MILSKHELDALDKGKRVTFDIGAHKRRVLMRSHQCRKDKKIYDFAVGFLNQIRKSGQSAADKRHMKNLIVLLKEELRHG